MLKADTTPNTFQITRLAEELPLFWQFSGGTAWRGGLIDVEYEVTFDAYGDWHISDLWIATDNGRCGPEAQTKLVNLPAHERTLWLLIHDSLAKQHETQIEEAIADELAARGLMMAA